MESERRDEMTLKFGVCSVLCFQNHSTLASQLEKMPNLEGPILNADAPTIYMKTPQKTRAKRVLPNWMTMIAAQGSTTKNTTSSDHTMGLELSLIHI